MNRAGALVGRVALFALCAGSLLADESAPFSPASLDLGEVAVGGCCARQFVIRSVLPGILPLARVESSAGMTIRLFRDTVGKGGALPVEFSLVPPGRAGAFTNDLTFVFGGVTDVVWSVRLTGVAVEADPDVIYPDMSFGRQAESRASADGNPVLWRCSEDMARAFAILREETNRAAAVKAFYGLPKWQMNGRGQFYHQEKCRLVKELFIDGLGTDKDRDSLFFGRWQSFSYGNCDNAEVDRTIREYGQRKVKEDDDAFFAAARKCDGEQQKRFLGTAWKARIINGYVESDGKGSLREFVPFTLSPGTNLVTGLPFAKGQRRHLGVLSGFEPGDVFSSGGETNRFDGRAWQGKRGNRAEFLLDGEFCVVRQAAVTNVIMVSGNLDNEKVAKMFEAELRPRLEQWRRLMEAARRSNDEFKAERERRRARREWLGITEEEEREWNANSTWYNLGLTGYFSSKAWREYVEGEGRAFADNENFKTNVFLPFLMKELRVSEEKNARMRAKIEDLLKREFADRLCQTKATEAIKPECNGGSSCLEQGNWGKSAEWAYQTWTKTRSKNPFILSFAPYHTKVGAWQIKGADGKPTFASVYERTENDIPRGRQGLFIRFMRDIGQCIGRLHHDKDYPGTPAGSLVNYCQALEQEGAKPETWRCVMLLTLGVHGCQAWKEYSPKLYAEALEKAGCAPFLVRLFREEPVFRYFDKPDTNVAH